MWGYSDPFDMFARGQQPRRQQKPQASWDPFAELRRQQRGYDDEEEDDEEQQKLAYEEALKREEENQRRMQEHKQRKFDDKHKKKQEYMRHQHALQKQEEEERRKQMMEEQLRKQEEEKRLMEEKKKAEREKWIQYASQPEIQEKSATNLQKVWRGRTVRLTKPIQNLRNLSKMEAQISIVLAKVPLALAQAKSATTLQDKKKFLKSLLSFEEELTRLLISLDTISGKNLIVRERRKNSVALCQRTVDAIDPTRKELAHQVYEMEQQEKLKQEQQPPVEPQPQSMETSVPVATEKTQQQVVEPATPVIEMEMASEPLEAAIETSTPAPAPVEEEPSFNVSEVPVQKPSTPIPIEIVVEDAKENVVPVEDQHKLGMQKRINELEMESMSDKKQIFELTQSKIETQLKVDQLSAELKAKTAIIELQQQRILQLEQLLASCKLNQK